MFPEISLAGQKIGRYILQKRIGRGGMGLVYTAIHERAPEKMVAIKLLLEGEYIDRFRREVITLRSMHHPNIMPLKDFQELREPISFGEGFQASAYLVMPFFSCGSLADRLRDHKEKSEKMPFDDITRIIRDMTTALDYAHQRGIIHRDIKPANILFGVGGEAILTDFGIALLTDFPRLTASHESLFTPYYASPEQTFGQTIGPTSDIYSLGVVLYQMVTNELPFQVESPAGWFQHLKNTPPRAISLFRSDVPEKASQIIQIALAKKPDKRYSDGAQLLREWEAAYARSIEAVPDITQKIKRTLHHSSMNFVGREQEMNALWHGLNNAIDGKPSTLILEGDAGIGKTEVIYQFIHQVRQQYPDLLIFHGEGNDSLLDGGGTPFYPFSQIFEQITQEFFRVENKAQPKITRRNVRRFWRFALRAAPAAVAAFVPVVGLSRELVKIIKEEFELKAILNWPGFLSSEKDKTLEQEHPLERMARVRDSDEINEDVLITQYCQALIELSHQKPMLVIVDSLQQADQSSWRLLKQLNEQIRRRQARILVIGSVRLAEISPEVIDTYTSIGKQSIVIEIGQGDPGKFVTGFIHRNYSHITFNPEFTKRLVEHTNANPRFLSVILEDLENRDLLNPNDQNRLAEQPAFEALELPKDISEMITARVDGLSNAKRTLLQHGSVQGQVFLQTVLAHTLREVYSKDWSDIDKINEPKLLSKIEDKLWDIPHLINSKYPSLIIKGQNLICHAFREGITQSFVYARIQERKSTHRILHQLVGKKLEELYQDEVFLIAPSLAYHFTQSGMDPWRVLYYANLTAQVLYNRYNMPAVHYWCDMALEAAALIPQNTTESESELPPYLELEWQTHEIKGDAYFFEGQWSEARKQYQVIFSQMEDQPKKDKNLLLAIEILRKDGETWRIEGDQQKALEQFHLGLKILDQNRLEAPPERASLHREIGYVLAQEEETHQAGEDLDHYLTARKLIENIPEEWSLNASICTCLGTAYERQVDVANNEYPTDDQRALLEKAIVWHNRSIELRETPLRGDKKTPRDRLGLAGSLANLGIVYEKLRDWEKCEENYVKSLDFLGEIGHVQQTAINRLNYGEMFRQKGTFQPSEKQFQEAQTQAAEQYRAALNRFIEVSDRFGEMLAHLNLSLVESGTDVRKVHALRALTIAALDERWWWVEYIPNEFLGAFTDAIQRETVYHELREYILAPPSELPASDSIYFPDNNAADDHEYLVLRMQQSDDVWITKVREVLGRVKFSK